MLALVGCQGVSSASKQSTTVNAGPGQLAVAPTTMSFGNVAVGSKSAQKGTLTAGTTDITVSSAAWNGQGYALSGITFPVTVPAGQSVPFSVTFDPQARRKCTGQRRIRERRDELSSHRNFDRNRNTTTTVSAQRCAFLESEQLASDRLQRLSPRIGRLLREDQSIGKRDNQLYRQLCPEWNDLRLRNHSD